MLGWEVTRCTSFVSMFLTETTSFAPSWSQPTITYLPNGPGLGCTRGAGVACGTTGSPGVAGSGAL